MKFVREVLYLSSEHYLDNEHRTPKPNINSPILYYRWMRGVGYGSVDAYDSVNLAGFVTIRTHTTTQQETSVSIDVNITLAINEYIGVHINKIIRSKYSLKYELYYIDDNGRLWFMESGDLSLIKEGNGFDVWRYSDNLSSGKYKIKIYAVGDYINAGLYLQKSLSVTITVTNFSPPPF